jgi:hypothetical protein
MEYLSSILWLLSWPLLIFIVYKVSWILTKKKGFLESEE